MSKSIIKLSGILMLSIAVFGCGKDDVSDQLVMENTENKVPSLLGISPQIGPKGTLVVIEGSNFGTDPSKVQVFFNNMEAFVQAMEATKITTTVPARAHTGNVKIIVGEQELLGPQFTYTRTMEVSTLAGNGDEGSTNGLGTVARFNDPHGTALDSKGNLYIADTRNHQIRRMSANGIVSTFAGGDKGHLDGVAITSKFDRPYDIAVDAQDYIYVSDAGNNKIRRISPDGQVITLAGTIEGDLDGYDTEAQFHFPTSIVVDADRFVYIADRENHKIKMLSPEGTVTTLAGSEKGLVDAQGSFAQFNRPIDLALDNNGNLLVTEMGNNTIRKIALEDKKVTTLVGSTFSVFSGVTGSTEFKYPRGITVDLDDNIYLATDQHTIVKIGPHNFVSTLSGSESGHEDGDVSMAKFNSPYGIAMNSDGAIYVVDRGNQRIRKISQE